MVSTIILTRNVKTISFHYIPPINKYKTKVIINSWEHKLLPALDSCKNYTICHVPRMLIYEGVHLGSSAAIAPKLEPELGTEVSC